MADDTRPLRLALATIAAQQVGNHEEGGNNLGPKVRQYQSATNLTPAAWPWCAAFAAWCLREWLRAPEVRRALGLTDDASVEAWRCHSAGAFAWETWGRSHALAVFSVPSTPLHIGDIVTYDFSHIGIVSRDQHTAEETVAVIEGNTNSEGDRDSEGGDGVWRKLRAPHLMRRAIRILA